ncbi:MULTISPECIES: DUF308 domain-containing protein [Bradyrhizobium]|uniref:DUF308 domain-containing protein n=1 Tax=Bradyrhizobium TaxID=374 RepID=UPI00155EF776|nr:MULTISPECIES: DUF308 domain-containing protein [Bradyrhizobium]MDD1517897.1 hypothetical protein [Bradyrhizobium sp. WBAH30]MDD1540756.1 hypothetical protein [Bradyrhizobium sp. WBAH41]MDD1555798.1 hypothetical protein [Bradyrhizobium sp. WBAH23]MDD1563391.1 hypothetical protein [Bradyrhizobium sp. WBAH33]MDD1588106.1 hypothetical protein [Bradyrhizobium sp. WBAH42]
MNLALLIVGICAVLAGLLAIIFGMTIREFSLGGTLIISGTIGVCSGMLLVGLRLVLLELKGLARRLAGAVAPSEVRVRPVLPGLAAPGAVAPEPVPAAAVRAEPAPPPPPASPPPWQSEAAARERPRAEAPQQEPEAPTPPAAPEAPRRRNLLFASTSRKERERAEAKSGEAAPPPVEPSEAPNLPPASFDVAWPKPDRTRPPEPPAAPRRPSPPPRSPSTFAETAPAPAPEPPPPVESAPPVTVLKSGIVDGMAYSLYSDGSIEAQMPEGMMRFASIDELRAHLDQRG